MPWGRLHRAYLALESAFGGGSRSSILRVACRWARASASNSSNFARDSARDSANSRFMSSPIERAIVTYSSVIALISRRNPSLWCFRSSSAVISRPFSSSQSRRRASSASLQDRSTPSMRSRISRRPSSTRRSKSHRLLSSSMSRACQSTTHENTPQTKTSGSTSARKRDLGAHRGRRWVGVTTCWKVGRFWNGKGSSSMPPVVCGRFWSKQEGWGLAAQAPSPPP